MLLDPVMTALSFNLSGGGSGNVVIVQHGVATELNSVTGININERGEATVTLIALKTSGHVQISEKMADAIIRADRRHLLGFLSPRDIDTLVDMRNAERSGRPTEVFDLLERILFEASEARADKVRADAEAEESAKMQADYAREFDALLEKK